MTDGFYHPIMMDRFRGCMQRSGIDRLVVLLLIFPAVERTMRGTMNRDGGETEMMENLREKYIFRTVYEGEAETAARIEQICFPPNEACILPIMKQRVSHAAECFLVAIEKSTGKMAGFINAMATDEEHLRDEFFTDISLHNPKGSFLMILSVAVLPQHRGQGLAAEMMDQLLERQKERKGAVLTCLESKTGLYRKMHFMDLGESASSWGGEKWHEMKRILI